MSQRRFPCRIEGCPSTGYRLSRLCCAHYKNLTERGDPLAFSQYQLVRIATAELWKRLHSPDAFEPGKCWEWPGASNTRGYGKCRRNGEEATHRAAWVELHGPIPKGKWVLHRCDNKMCVRPSHVYLGTPKQNTQDMLERDRAWRAFNEDNLHTIWPTEQVREAKRRVAAGERVKDVAEEFGMKPSYVSGVCHGRNRPRA